MTTNKDANMERPLVMFRTMSISGRGSFIPCFRVGGYYHYMTPSKVLPPKDIPPAFRVHDVYRFPMHEDMRLTVVPDGGVLPVELQFKCNESFIAAAMPKKVEETKPKPLCKPFVRGAASAKGRDLDISGVGKEYRLYDCRYGLDPVPSGIVNLYKIEPRGETMEVWWESAYSDKKGWFVCRLNQDLSAAFGVVPKGVEPPKSVYKYAVVDGRLVQGRVDHTQGVAMVPHKTFDVLIAHELNGEWYDTPDAAIIYYENNRAMELARATHSLVESVKSLRKQAEAFQ